MFGNAVKLAAEEVRATLAGVAAGMLGARAEEIELAEGSAFVRGDRGRSLALAAVAGEASARGLGLAGSGWFRAPRTTWDHETGKGDAYFTYVYGANVAEVEVDTLTGRVEVTRVTAVHDVGRAINPAAVRSQVYGGVAMGAGYALLEEYASRGGVPLQENLDEYLLLTAMDMPEVAVGLVEGNDPAGPWGAKSIGEPAVEIVAPAIANAIFHATGRRVDALPASLERVLLGRALDEVSPPAGGRPEGAGGLTIPLGDQEGAT